MLRVLLSCVVVHVCSSLGLVLSHVKLYLEIFCILRHRSDKQKKRKEKAEGAKKKGKKATPKKEKE